MKTLFTSNENTNFAAFDILSNEELLQVRGGKTRDGDVFARDDDE